MKPAVTKTPSMFWHILWLQTGGMEFERHGQTCCSIIQLHCKIQCFFLETDYALQSTILWLTKRDLRLPLQNCLITPKIAVSQIDPPIRKACLEFHWMWDLSWIHTWEYCMSNLWQALSHWFVTPVSVNVCGRENERTTPSLKKWFWRPRVLSRVNDSWSELPVCLRLHPPSNKRNPLYFCTL